MPKNHYNAFKHRIYAHPEIWNAFKKLCAIRRKVVSRVIVQFVKSEIRQNAVKLRKAKFPYPQLLADEDNKRGPLRRSDRAEQANRLRK